jgi:hypothetical protein
VAFGDQRHELGDVKGEPQAEHARLLAPFRDEPARRGVQRIEPAHRRVAVRVREMRGCREVVAVALPRRRDDDDALDAGFVHFTQQVFVPQRYRALRFRAFGPWPLRRVRAPDVNL